MGKGRGGMLAQVAELKAYKFAVQHGKAAFQYGFIPLIIIIGMNTDPKPTLFQLLSPM